MNSSTTFETRSRSDPTRADQKGVSLAVADVGWFNTENLFREIDRESVAVLLLKCQDYVNGWRRGLYPWSRACRLRQLRTNVVGAAARLAQRVDEALSRGWECGRSRESIRGWWRTQPAFAAARAGDVVPALSLPARPASARRLGLLQHRRLHAVLAPIRPPDPGAGARRPFSPPT